MRLKFISIFFASFLFLFGCGANVPDNGSDTDEGAIQPTRYNEQQNRHSRTQDGIRDRARTNDSQMHRDRDRSNVLPRTGPHTDHQGINRRNDDRTDQQGMNQRNDNRTDHQGMNQRNDNRYNVSKEAADKITDQMNEIHQAYVLTTNNNAYVAVSFNHDQTKRQDNNRTTNRTRDTDVTDQVKAEISDIVRSVDKDIDNVYVSTNPDFLDLTNNYIRDFNDGRPVRGMFDQLGEMIERLFPQDRR